MDIKIEIKDTKTREFDDFKLNAWKKINVKHYGVEFDDEYWMRIRILIEATENGKIVGVLESSFMAGVLHIEELVVDEEHKGLGIGRSLLEKVESWARDHGGHLVHLDTGANWNAKSFYLDNGYEVVGTLKDFYSKIDYVVMVKHL